MKNKQAKGMKRKREIRGKGREKKRILRGERGRERK